MISGRSRWPFRPGAVYGRKFIRRCQPADVLKRRHPGERFQIGPARTGWLDHQEGGSDSGALRERLITLSARAWPGHGSHPKPASPRSRTPLLRRSGSSWRPAPADLRSRPWSQNPARDHPSAQVPEALWPRLHHKRRGKYDKGQASPEGLASRPGRGRHRRCHGTDGDVQHRGVGQRGHAQSRAAARACQARIALRRGRLARRAARFTAARRGPGRCAQHANRMGVELTPRGDQQELHQSWIQHHFRGPCGGPRWRHGPGVRGHVPGAARHHPIGQHQCARRGDPTAASHPV